LIADFRLTALLATLNLRLQQNITSLYN